ncbi:MAG: proline--tRNA ligase [Candidatus Dojkabacteria bacterium]|nr:proline--tRNA ligase [Candidatus Dojkabacteria bacterium]
MRYSRLFGKTVRKARKEMTAVSHKLLYMGGFIRELSAGRYEFLPLGFRVWRKIVDLIDSEMEIIGSQRFSIPILQPMDFWSKSNRDKAWGKSLMKLKDRSGAEFALSATGEGVVTEMVAGTNPTYKDLPITVHQFIVKLRDEKRARGGLLRTREFVMKDAYSFNESEDDFMKTYNSFYKAYSRICEQLGLQYYACIADSGALGGDYCHEFQVPCEAGEDHIAKCDSCDYTANNEKAEFIRKEVNKNEKMKEYKMVDLPEKVQKIKDLMKHYNLPAERFIKNVLYKTLDGKKLIIATVTGDLDINAVKLAKAVGEDELEIGEDKDLKSIGSKTGYLHSWGYDEFKDKIVYVVDEGITKARNLYGGYKTETQDPQNVNYGRDFKADIVADIAEPYEGALCKKCKGNLKLIKTIEWGHIFKYDHFYTKHHNGYFTDRDGKRKLMYMGAYGIGIGRSMGTIVESHNDEKGIIWPITIAPFQVHLVSLGESKEILDKAASVYEELGQNDIEVLWDDREEESAGVKFNDADLIGIPIRLVVSVKSFERGGVELKLRTSEESEIIKLEDILETVKRKIKSLKDEFKPKTKY